MESFYFVYVWWVPIKFYLQDSLHRIFLNIVLPRFRSIYTRHIHMLHALKTNINNSDVFSTKSTYYMTVLDENV